MSQWKHNDLAADLAAHLRGNTRERMIWCDMQLGPAGSPRPDVYCIDCTYSRFRATAYEVKISRSDFLSDVTSGKALRYLDFAGALVFAVPAGLVDKSEVPDGCGLIVRGEGGWRHTKKPVVKPLENLPRDAWMKLLMDGRSRDVGARNPIRVREYNTWKHAETVRRVLGEELAKLVSDRASAEMYLRAKVQQLEEARSRAAEEAAAHVKRATALYEEQLESLRREIAEIATSLGMAPTSHAVQIANRLRSMRPERDREYMMTLMGELRRHARALSADADMLAQHLGIGQP